LKRDAAPGVDGVTWTEYETGLGERLKDLHSRVHQGTYRAQPSKRTYIPKADGRQRPLGIAALEDKIIQHAVVTVLCAGINRHEVENERVLRERTSDLLGPEFCTKRREALSEA
jgi:retron-type reverse transcriptase